MMGKIIWYGFALAAFLFVYVGLKMAFLVEGAPKPIEHSVELDVIRSLIYHGFGVTWLALASIGLKINERR